MNDLIKNGYITDDTPIDFNFIHLSPNDIETGPDSLLNASRRAVNWKCSDRKIMTVNPYGLSVKERVILALNQYSILIQNYLGNQITILGVQDINIDRDHFKTRRRYNTRNSSDEIPHQGFHRDINCQARKYLILFFDTLGRSLQTEVIPESHGLTPLYDEMVSVHNIDNKFAPQCQRLSSEMFKVCEDSVMLFDPTIYHRGTNRAPKNGHRLFIMLACGYKHTSHLRFVRENLLKSPWNLRLIFVDGCYTVKTN